MVKGKLVKEWLDKGKKDIDDAEFLLEHNRSAENIAFHIHQSAEKYLKGFLIYHGLRLEKIHDLVKLLENVIKIDKRFSKFSKPLQKITNFYFESRYPVGYEVEYTKNELKEAITKIKALNKLVNEIINREKQSK